MEISIKVELNEKNDLENFIEECQKHGFLITREGGGKMPNYSGYFAQLKGERWKKLHTSDSGLNIAGVMGLLPDEEEAKKEAELRYCNMADKEKDDITYEWMQCWEYMVTEAVINEDIEGNCP